MNSIEFTAKKKWPVADFLCPLARVRAHFESWRSYRKSVWGAAACQQTGQVGGKEILLSFRCWPLQRGGVGEWRGGLTSVQSPIPSPGNQWTTACIAERGGYTQKQQSAPTAIFILLTSLVSVILVVSSIVSLLFQRPFVPISLRPILRIVAAFLVGTVLNYA